MKTISGNQGKCIIVSAPSGAGKTTVVHHLLNAGLNLEFSVSATSRPSRTGETDGKDYYFISPDEFRKKINAKAFVEWQEVYPGSYYGTLKSEIQRIWRLNRHVIFDVDVFGGINLKKIFGKNALGIFIMPPSIEILEIRLRKRSSDNESSLIKRLEKAKLELGQKNHFDRVIINDQLEETLCKATELVTNFLKIT